MRGVLAGLAAIIVVALGFWAYEENYATQDAVREHRDVERAIERTERALGMLRA